jgi:hypothetical protein
MNHRSFLFTRLWRRIFSLCAAMMFVLCHAAVQAQPSLIELTDSNGCKLYSSFGPIVKTIVLGRVMGARCEKGLYQGAAVYGVYATLVRPDGTTQINRTIHAGVLLDGKFDGLNLFLNFSGVAFLFGLPSGRSTFFNDSSPGSFSASALKAVIDMHAPSAGGQSPEIVATHLKNVADQWSTQREQLLQLIQSSNAEVVNPNWVAGGTSPASTAPAPAATPRDDPKVMGGGARPR